MRFLRRRLLVLPLVLLAAPLWRHFHPTHSWLEGKVRDQANKELAPVTATGLTLLAALVQPASSSIATTVTAISRRTAVLSSICGCGSGRVRARPAPRNCTCCADRLAAGYIDSMRRSTRSSTLLKGSLQSTVRCAWSLSLRCTQSTV